MNNLLLVDDHEIIRSGVKNVLQDLFKPEEVFEAGDEKSAIAQLKARPYQLIICDIRMPGSQPFGLTEYIVKNYPDARVLIFSMNDESVYAKRFLQAGAMGFVSKNAGLAELRKAIGLALNGRKYISSDLSDQLASMLNKDQTSSNQFDNLSRRELEIATLLIEGKSLVEISELLTIASSTAGTHKNRLFEKLGIKNLAELIELGRTNNV